MIRDLKARLLTFVVICGTSLPFACRKLPNGSSMERGEALKASDAFIDAVVHDHLDDAMNMMEPEFVQSTGLDQARALASQVLDYCGHPQHVELSSDETGTAFYADGRAKAMRRFFYANVKDGKERCIFTIDVVPSEGGMKVGKFGSLKPTS